MPGGPRKDTRNANREVYDKGDAKGAMKMRRAKRKICAFCMDKVKDIDYKDIPRLKKFVSERGKILPRRISGNCAKHQRQMTVAVKRARHIALLPFSSD